MLNFLRKSLLSQLVSSFSVLSLVTVSLVAIAAYIRARDSLRDSVYNRLQVATSLKEYQLDDWVTTQYQDVLLIARSPVILQQAKHLLGTTTASTPLTVDSDPAEILEVQKQLKQLNYYEGVIDGVFGSGTEAAIAKFKQAQKLPPQAPLTLKNLNHLIAYQVISQELSGFAQVKPSLQEISLLTTGGIVTLSTNKAKEKTYQPLGTTTTYFTQNQSAAVIPTFYTSPITRKSAITFATPIFDQSGERLGVLAVDLDLQGIDDIIREKTGLGETGETYLIGRLGNRNVFISQQGDQVDTSTLQAVNSFGIDQATQGNEGLGLYRNYKGIPVIGAYVWMTNQNLALLAEMSQAEAFKPAQRLLKEILQIGLSAALFLLIIIYLISRRITQPILGITETAIQVRSGNLSSQAPVLTEDEIGTLARAFNQMISQLQESKMILEDQVNFATQSLQETLANLTSIIDNIADGLLVTNTEGKITQTNQALFKLFGLQSLDIVQSNSQDIFGNIFMELQGNLIKDPDNVLKREIDLPENKIGKIVATGVFKQESPENPEKIFLGCVFLIRDITADKEVDRMKTEFISTVSHELRTPLTSVLGFAKLIKKKLDEVVFPQINVSDKKMKRAVDQVSNNLEIIVSEGVRLTALINDVLDLAKMEAGKVDWKNEVISIDQIIERATIATTALFSQRDLKLVVKVEPNLPKFQGDQDKLMQVLINLISNAVKFTEQGTVTCQAKKQGETIIVQVIDTGIGIKKEDIPQVFEKFKQVGDTLTNKPKGTGLGLPICKEIIEHHGGQIWAESEVGVGSTFAFWLPIEEKEVHPPFPDDHPPAIGWNQFVEKLSHNSVNSVRDGEDQTRRILVVDDDPHIREWLTQELDMEGYRVLQAASGQEAIAQIKHQKPDLVVLDVIMPDLNGFEVAAILKNDPETSHIPILMISIDDRAEKGYRIGVDDYLTKPIEANHFLQRVQALLNQQHSSKRVLVFDQQSSTVQTLTEVLQVQGYQMLEVDTDQALLAVNPDVVIAEVNIANQSRLVKTVQFQKGPDQVIVFLLETQPIQNGNPTETTD